MQTPEPNCTTRVETTVGQHPQARPEGELVKRKPRRPKKLSRRKCKECQDGFLPLNRRHHYCSHRCKNRAAARRRYRHERKVARAKAYLNRPEHKKDGLI